MKAAVFSAPFNISVKEVADPQPAPGEALIKVKATGICGGDLHFYDGTHPYTNYPRIYGHEFTGVVESLPAETAGLSVGDRVVIEPLLPCGHCYPCRKGKYNCCVNLKVIGVHTDGGFAEYVAVPVKRLHKLPAAMPFEVAVIIEPYSIGAQCVKRAEVAPDETVLVIGAGAIGLTIIDLAKAIGARVIAVDTAPFRIDTARKLGADVVIDASRENLNERVLTLTDGEGAGIVIDATGSSKVMENTENLVAAGGIITIVGLTNDKVAFTGINFTKREMTIKGSRNSANIFPSLIDAFKQGNLHPNIFLTHKFSFDRITEAFDFTYNNLKDVAKAAVFFS